MSSYSQEIYAMYAEVLSVRQPNDELLPALVDNRGIEETRDLLTVILKDTEPNHYLNEIENVARTAEIDLTRHEISASMEAWRKSLQVHTNNGTEPDFGNRLLEAAWGNEADLMILRDPGWPHQIDDLGHTAPIAVWGRTIGETTVPVNKALSDALANPERPVVALTGSRETTEYGNQVSSDFAQAVAENGGTVINGGGYGAEAASLRAAVAATHGKSVAVLAGGINRLYPAGNENLLREVGSQGVLISEQHPDAAPTRNRFLDRNRLIAALADTTIVTEARPRSSALSTAAWSQNLGRPTGAVSGSIYSAASEGTNNLIQQGQAEPILSYRDVLSLAEETGRATFRSEAHLDAHSAEYQASTPTLIAANSTTPGLS